MVCFDRSSFFSYLNIAPCIAISPFPASISLNYTTLELIESLSATYLTFRRKRLKPIHTLTLTFLNSHSGLGLNLNDTMTLFLTLLCHLNCNLPSMMWC